MMKPISKLKYFQLTLFGKPACDRKVYKTVCKQRVSSIVEIGLGDGARASNLIRLAQTYSGSADVRYTGVDMFEGRNDGNALALRTAYKDLNALGAKVRLVPGELATAVPSIANAHVRTDLIVISGNYDPASIDSCWFYVPRMLHAGSTVLLQSPDSVEGEFDMLTRLDVERMANRNKEQRKSAA